MVGLGEAWSSPPLRSGAGRCQQCWPPRPRPQLPAGLRAASAHRGQGRVSVAAGSEEEANRGGTDAAWTEAEEARQGDGAGEDGGRGLGGSQRRGR